MLSPVTIFKLYSFEKFALISDEPYLHFFPMHIMMSNVAKVILVMMVIVKMNFILPSSPSRVDSIGGNVKIACAGKMHG